MLPRYLEHLKKETNQRDNPPAARAEINTINDIGTSLKAVLTSCEFFTRSVLRLFRIFPKTFTAFLIEVKRRDLVFDSPSFRPPIEVGTLWAQLLLEFSTDSFETSLVFWSWSEDMHVVRIYSSDYFLSLF